MKGPNALPDRRDLRKDQDATLAGAVVHICLPRITIPSTVQHTDLETLELHALDADEARKQVAALDEIRKRFEKSL